MGNTCECSYNKLELSLIEIELFIKNSSEARNHSQIIQKILEQKPKDQLNTQIQKSDDCDGNLQAYNIDLDEHIEGNTVSKMQSYKSSNTYCASGKKNHEQKYQIKKEEKHQIQVNNFMQIDSNKGISPKATNKFSTFTMNSLKKQQKFLSLKDKLLALETKKDNKSPIKINQNNNIINQERLEKQTILNTQKPFDNYQTNPNQKKEGEQICSQQEHSRYNNTEKKPQKNSQEIENCTLNSQSAFKSKRTATIGMNDFKKFKYISDIHSKYKFGKFLGKGAFGKVLRCIHKDSGSEFAIKIMEKKMVRQRKVYVQLLENELAILGSKSHPKIIRVIDLLEDKLNYFIVSEIVEGGELFKRLCELESFTENQAAYIIQQIMLGLNYLHLQSITHRDMKPENILLVSNDKNNFEIKISDLGFAQKFDKNQKGMTLVLGSPLYMAPELVNREPYTEKVDVWSLGVITYQLLSGKTPFESDSIKKIDWNINNKKITFQNTSDENWSDISQDAKNFILKCLNRDPNSRFSIQQLFKEPWIQNYNKQMDKSLDEEGEEVSQSIKKNLIQYRCLNQFQKLVLSLVSGLCASPQELKQLQEEFMRLDVDHKGTLSADDIKKIADSEFGKKYQQSNPIDWDIIIQECDLDGDGQIDFQDFIAACLDRKFLVKTNEIKKAFQIIDTDKDGEVTLCDFQKLFHSSNKRSQIDQEFWEQILREADKNGDGKITFNEFQQTMQAMVRKSWLRKADRSPSKSPCKSQSPTKNQGVIISPDRGGNPFKKAMDSPCKKFKLVEMEIAEEKDIYQEQASLRVLR